MRLQQQDYIVAEKIQRELVRRLPTDPVIQEFTKYLPSEALAQRKAMNGQGDEEEDEDYYDEEEPGKDGEEEKEEDYGKEEEEEAEVKPEEGAVEVQAEDKADDEA